MNTLAFGAKPTVLRCSRCGKFVDWEDARLQVVCGCRPHLDLPPVRVRPAEDRDRRAVNELFNRDFGRTRLIIFGEELHLDTADVVVAEMEGDIAGALAHRVRDDALQILALATDPMWQRSGVGAYLVAEAEQMARAEQKPNVLVATTNDNLPSLYFYQRRGYRISEVLAGAVARHFNDQPSVGFAGIPIRDEIHLVKAV
ncbi:MAG: GNAT family N-acetyltransferase [Vicinamibacterales bacterium]|nr:GNAT family N-acetyltransferase [Vicinamibacterales bacterium]